MHCGAGGVGWPAPCHQRCPWLPEALLLLYRCHADPYLNVDAGTMSPFEHGEVFVLDDGGEVGEGRGRRCDVAGQLF